MVQVHGRQKNSALLSCIKSVKWTFAEIPADFVIAQNICALVLSLKYHNQYPNYIYDRMTEVGKAYQVQILVVIVDISDPNANLKELAKVCIMADFTLMCCWSVEEAARIIEQYKMSEKKSPASLMADQLANINGIGDKNQCVREALTCIKSVNKTDALQLVSFESMRAHITITDNEEVFDSTSILSACSRLVNPLQGTFSRTTHLSLFPWEFMPFFLTFIFLQVSNFESLEKIVAADADALAMCPGLGPQKAERLYKAFHAPFVRKDWIIFTKFFEDEKITLMNIMEFGELFDEFELG